MWANETGLYWLKHEQNATVIVFNETFYLGKYNLTTDKARVWNRALWW